MELQTTIERIDTIAEPRAKSSAVRRPPVTAQEVKTTRPIHLGLLREKLQCLGKTGDLASRTVKLLRLPCSRDTLIYEPHLHAEIGPYGDDDFGSLYGGTRGSAARSGASFEAVLRSQDAPRVSSASNCLFAMTRLASPNRLNSCASFFAKPL